MENNKNKGNLIINNKKYILKEFINNKEFKDYEVKINMILYKGLSNISHIFENCTKLKEMLFCDDEIFIEDEATLKLEEYNNYNIDSNFYDNFTKYSYDGLYNNLITDGMHSISKCSIITKKTT